MKRSLLLVPVLALCWMSCSDTQQPGGRAGRIDDPLQTSGVLSGTVLGALSAEDIAGVYTGVLPCADCAGIEMTLTVKEDETYRLEQRYQGREGTFTHEGKWRLSEDVLELDGVTDAPNKYLVEAGRLVMLDMEGKKVEGALAESYILKKR